MERIGSDARTTRLALGWTQADLARRARMSQASISRLEAGDLKLAVSIATRAFAALGMQLVLKAYRADGVGLRDSGQSPWLSKSAPWLTLLGAPSSRRRPARVARPPTFCSSAQVPAFTSSWTQPWQTSKRSSAAAT